MSNQNDKVNRIIDQVAAKAKEVAAQRSNQSTTHADHSSRPTSKNSKSSLFDQVKGAVRQFKK